MPRIRVSNPALQLRLPATLPSATPWPRLSNTLVRIPQAASGEDRDQTNSRPLGHSRRLSEQATTTKPPLVPCTALSPPKGSGGNCPVGPNCGECAASEKCPNPGRQTLNIPLLRWQLVRQPAPRHETSETRHTANATMNQCRVPRAVRRGGGGTRTAGPQDRSLMPKRERHWRPRPARMEEMGNGPRLASVSRMTQFLIV
jgi:hypothetical protein